MGYRQIGSHQMLPPCGQPQCFAPLSQTFNFVLDFRGMTSREIIARDKSVTNFPEESLDEVSY